MNWRTFLAIAACLSASITAAVLAGDGSGATAGAGTRAAGVVAYGLLWLAVETGIATHMHFHLPRVRSAVLLETHRIASSLAFAFLVGHVWGLLVDPAAGISSVEVFVPFAPVPHMLARTAGSLGFWTTLIALSTSAYLGRVPYRVWRRAHVLTFPAFFLSLLHGMLAGSHFNADPWTSFYVATGGVVAATCALRVLTPRPMPRRATRRVVSPIAERRPIPAAALRLRGQHSSVTLERMWHDFEHRPPHGQQPRPTRIRPAVSEPIERAG